MGRGGGSDHVVSLSAQVLDVKSVDLGRGTEMREMGKCYKSGTMNSHPELVYQHVAHQGSD